MLCTLIFLLKNNQLFLILLMGLLPISASAAPLACGNLQLQKSCRTSSQTSLNREPARKNDFYQNSDHLDSFFMQLEKESLQKVEALQKDLDFQETVTRLQKNSPHSQYTRSNSSSETQANLNDASLNDAGLYIFVSFSMGEKALLNLAQEAKQFEATLVLKGFREGSYIKTAQALQKIITKTGQGVLIDPELYTLFNVMSVPTYVLAKPFSLSAQERTQTPIKWAPMHDKLQGHVSVHYALETVAKEGDLKDEAQALLKKGTAP